ncbi:MAG TPA: dihydroorotase [Candidatus Paceibacterota bacterium]
MTDAIIIKKPFDSHVHLRSGAMLKAVAPITAQKFSAGLIMPNTEPPIETVAQAAKYKEEILAATGDGFQPLMSFYLTRTLKTEEIEKGAAEKAIFGIKSYPWGATTNSQWGFRNILEAGNLLQTMEKVGMPLLLHGEVHLNDRDEEEDPYDGEKLFFQNVLPRLLEKFPDLKISLEHMTTKVGAEFMEKNGAEGKLVATITPHHLMYDRTQAFNGGYRALLHCKPLIKRAEDREAVRSLATKGLPFVSAGTDTAPHPEAKKFSSCCAFGVFNSPVAVEMYAQVFDEMNALDKLEGFLSLNGPRFFGIEPSTETITLVKKDWQVTDPVVTSEGVKVWPVGHKEHGLGNETFHWQIS